MICKTDRGEGKYFPVLFLLILQALRFWFFCATDVIKCKNVNSGLGMKVWFSGIFFSNILHVKLLYFLCFFCLEILIYFAFIFKSFAAVAEFTSLSCALKWQSRTKLFPIAETRLGRQLPAGWGQNPRGAASGLFPSVHHFTHHGLQPRLEEQVCLQPRLEEPVLVVQDCCWTPHLAPSAPCHLTPSLPVLHLRKKSMVPLLWLWGWPAKFGLPKLMDSPQCYLRRTPTYGEVLQLWAEWLLATGLQGRSNILWAKTSLSASQRRMWRCYGLHLSEKLLGVGEESNKPEPESFRVQL